MVIGVGNVSEVVNRLNYPDFRSVQTKIPPCLSSFLRLLVLIVVAFQYLHSQDALKALRSKQGRQREKKKRRIRSNKIRKQQQNRNQRVLRDPQNNSGI